MGKNGPKVNFSATLIVNIMRGIAAGIVWAAIVLFTGTSKGSPAWVPLIFPITFPILMGIMLPVYFFLKTIGLGGVGSMAAMLFSVPGDPLIFILKKLAPHLVPVDDFNIINFSGFILVYDGPGVENKTGFSNNSSGLFIENKSKVIIGRIEPDGGVFNSNLGGSLVGYVDNSGMVYKSGLMGKGEIVGRLESNGYVFDSNSGGNYVGKVGSDGMVFLGPGSGSYVGKGGNQAGGAALLMLLQ
ncbi:MAG: hypothetical protein ACD_19C00006G0001 [uncultured bacterium]|nr:MAG: hypothetical protein ACD_19C00006G0001 [uncultured bacterium]